MWYMINVDSTHLSLELLAGEFATLRSARRNDRGGSKAVGSCAVMASRQMLALDLVMRHARMKNTFYVSPSAPGIVGLD